MKKILIFEPNSPQAQVLAKFIKKYSDYYIVGCVKEEIHFNRNNFNEIITSEFVSVNVRKYDYVLPMGANSTYITITKYKEFFYCNDMKFSIQNLVVFEKEKMLNIASNLGVPIPNTYYKLECVEEYPIFYKEDFENGGGVRGVAVNMESVPTSTSLIYQEYIDTPSTYGMSFLAQDGKILTYTLHKEIISYPKDGGSSVVIESFADKRIIDYTKEMLKELNYNGWGLSEFKYCKKRDDFVFMEINGKFWASIEFMLRENPQFLKYLLDISYTKIETKRILFINRLLQYEIRDILKNMKYLGNSFIAIESSLTYQVLRQCIPDNFVNRIKKFLQ